MSLQKPRRTFISYSRINKEFALELALELRNSGFDIWLDQLDIPTGSRWDDEVERALEECEIFMVILTPASSISDNVKDEIGYAIDAGKRILPILLENAKVPLRLTRFNYVDFTKKSYEEGVEGAKQLLRRLIDEPTLPVDQVLEETKTQIAEGEEVKATKLDTAPFVQKHETPAVPPAKKSRLPMVLGTVGVGFIAVVAIAVFVILNGFGRGTPDISAPENNLSAETIGASPAPLVVEEKSTPTPAPTQTQMVAQPTSTIAPTVVTDTPTAGVQKYGALDFEGDDDLQSWPTFIADGRRDLEQPVITDEEFSEISTSVKDGLYFFDIDRRQTYVYSYYDSFTYQDARVDARIDSRNINVSKTSLICRYSPDGGWYEFRIANNGPYGIYYAKPNPHGLVTYRTLADGNTKLVNPGNDVNEYSIICQGDDTLSLYVNGELVRTTSDLLKVLRTGKIGVSVSSINSLPVRVGVDWIKISEPE